MKVIVYCIQADKGLINTAFELDSDEPLSFRRGKSSGVAAVPFLCLLVSYVLGPNVWELCFLPPAMIAMLVS